MVFSAIKEAWNFVDRPLRKLFGILLFVRVITNFFDLIGTVLMAVLVGYVVNILSGSSQAIVVQPVINFLNLGDYSSRDQVVILGLITLTVFVLKPLTILPISRILIFKIHKKGANLTNTLISNFVNLPLSAIKNWSGPDVNYAATQGLPYVLSLLWSTTTMISDVVLIVMFLVLLFLSNPIITLGLLIYVLLLFSLLAWINGARIMHAGRQVGQTSSNSTKGIMELMSMFRELYVSNRLHHMVTTFRDNRISYGEAIATADWLGQVPRFVIDSALVLGIVIISIGQSSSESISSAATDTALFLTAALRILPTIIPIQNSINSIKNMKGITERVHLFSKYVERETTNRNSYLKNLPQNFSVKSSFKITSKNLTYKYLESANPAIEDISFEINSGSTLAIIGASGSGKTTLADCLLGLIEPTKGGVDIDGTAPEIYRTMNSGSIAYVSQDVALIDGSIKENVAFALPEEEVDAEKICTALKRAHIFDFVMGLPQGLETVVGERGTRLSGGQRQRIGIARALYSNPKILVLDEATSALDAETESAITGMLKELHGQVTIISIAHRLSTVMHSDHVLFLRDGKLAGSGKFEDLVKQHPDLAHQAELLGIDVDAKENN
jgi:ABC-type multidrug transport system fused ATPase/permease subunit